MMAIEPRAEFARSLDLADPLANFRERFVIDQPELLYLDGNSLGRLPKAAEELASNLIKQQWGQRLVRGWGDGWYHLPERVGGKIASLIGADPEEVIVADSTSVNLFKLAVAALNHRADRNKILTDDLNFPSDLYILEGASRLAGDRYKVVKCASEDRIFGPVEKIKQELDEDTVLLTLSHVVFKSGYLYDLKDLTSAAHEAGALVLWDLSHSVGAVPIDLTAAGVDLAVGCTYKYLNGGPGAPAFLYVRKELQAELLNPISGWMGSEQVFDFLLSYTPDPGIRRFLSGTPPVISLAMIEAGVDILVEAGIERVRQKSIQQTEYLAKLIELRLEPFGFSLKSPLQPEMRGSHLAISHPEGLRINKALIGDMNVIPDFRAPDNIRLGIAPLYTRFIDLYELVERIHQVMAAGLYKKYSKDQPTVT
jgi:kynureninase